MMLYLKVYLSEEDLSDKEHEEITITADFL